MKAYHVGNGVYIIIKILPQTLLPSQEVPLFRSVIFVHKKEITFFKREKNKLAH